MSLIAINPAFIDRVWPEVGPMLQRAIDIDPGEGSLDQLEYAIRRREITLLVWFDEEEQAKGAATVEFIDRPKYRLAHVSYMAGSGVVRAQVFEAAQEWMRANGATKAQCWCKENLVPMYEKMGMSNDYRVMRMDL